MRVKTLIGATVKNNILLILLGLISNSTWGKPCLGKGTKIYYGNGMFNSKIEALNSLEHLKNHTEYLKAIYTDKELEYDISYKPSERFLAQLFNVFLEKQTDNFELFWLWLNSNIQQPEWYKKALLEQYRNFFGIKEKYYREIRSHLEKYNRAIYQGYNVILVSHSQGNLFANQAARNLGDYINSGYLETINEFRAKNPMYPEFKDIFANIQVATPNAATEMDSPWTTLNDDLHINLIRSLSGALRANIFTPGAHLANGGDLLGHSFVKAYLRNNESRKKIISDIESAFKRLKYPISQIQKLATITDVKDFRDKNYGDLMISTHDDINYYDFRRIEDNKLKTYSGSHCSELTAREYTIMLEAHRPFKPYDAQIEGWPDGANNPETEQKQLISLSIKKSWEKYKLGSIRAAAGTGKEPLDVEVELYNPPKPILD